VHLDGLFKISPGRCAGATGLPTGSYLVVLSAASGKTVGNPDGGCANPAYTLLKPGTDGGLITGEFQQVGGATFDRHGNSRDDRVLLPVRFGKFRVGFGTDSHDEQDAPNGAPAYPDPSAIVEGTALRIDLRSLVVSYAGAPGSSCDTTYGVGCWELGSENAAGTYDAATGHYSIQWFSGASFTPRGDSIEVHLEGTFVPKATSSDVVSPLSAPDRAALESDRRLIESLPSALREVPQAAADVAGIDVATARGEIAAVAALRPLAGAIDGRSAAVSELEACYRATLDGRRDCSPDDAPVALATLQEIEGDILPSLRVVALSHGRHLGAADALIAVERDPKTDALGNVLAEWSQTYGAFLLMEQSSLS
jgi:hypothetical protein